MSEGIKRSKPYLREATREDCIRLASNLRHEDAEEILHSSGLLPEQGLLLSYHSSAKTWAGVWGDEIVLVGGIGQISETVGSPWMLASPSLVRIRKSLLSWREPILASMLSMYPHLENHVWAGNPVHIEWLKWLGFTVQPAQPNEISGQLFHRFYMKDNNVHNRPSRVSDSCR